MHSEDGFLKKSIADIVQKREKERKEKAWQLEHIF